MQNKKKKRFYAVRVMKLILITAGMLTALGYLLSQTLLSGLPQYDGAAYMAIPMMLLQDSGPLRQARERAAWEAEQERLAAETAEATPAPTTEPTPEPTPEATPEPTLEPTPEPTPEPEPEPTPEPELVPESYFDHTLFIGDSKTDEMRTYYRLGEAQYFCDTSFSVYNVFDKTATDPAFSKVKLDWVLKHFEYDQIYIMLGYNECGYPYSGLMEQFDYVIRRVHEAQPEARIILHGVMHPNYYVSQSDYCYTPENLEHINDGLRAFAEADENIFYVDCNEPFCDENGYLLSYVSLDGEHLLPQYSCQWAQEIRKRAVVE